MSFELSIEEYGIFEGSGSVQNFYQNSIFLTNLDGSGSISGIFAGRNANAIISSIVIDTLGYGTALFRKNNSIGIGQ